ncbi:MAG: hypothetical protein RR540_04915 [Oscillospiraceae bacterium]
MFTPYHEDDFKPDAAVIAKQSAKPLFKATAQANNLSADNAEEKVVSEEVNEVLTTDNASDDFSEYITSQTPLSKKEAYDKESAERILAGAFSAPVFDENDTSTNHDNFKEFKKEEIPNSDEKAVSFEEKDALPEVFSEPVFESFDDDLEETVVEEIPEKAVEEVTEEPKITMAKTFEKKIEQTEVKPSKQISQKTSSKPASTKAAGGKKSASQQDAKPMPKQAAKGALQKNVARRNISPRG